MNPEKPLLELNTAERVVEVKVGGRAARHFFRPLTLADWRAYYQAQRFEVIEDEETVRSEAQLLEAASQLWAAAILRVEGYKTGEDWKQRMPLGQQLAAVLGLRQVVATGGGDPFDLEAGQRRIELEARWNLETYKALAHVFREPSRDDELQFRRLTSGFYRLKGARGAATRIRIPTQFAAVCGFYDRLIVSVEGYAFSLEPLASSGAIVQHMDPLHKEVAVMALFNPPEEPAAVAEEIEVQEI